MRTNKTLLVLSAVLLAATSCASEPATGDTRASARSVLQERFGADTGPSAEIRIGDLVAECMSAAGFEYTHTPPEVAQAAATDLVAWSDPWVATYGLGVSTLMYAIEVVGPEAIGFETAEQTAATPEPSDTYLDGLSSGERMAYELALYGPEPDFAEMADGSFHPTGCLADAIKEVETPYADFVIANELEFEGFHEAALSDPRYLDALDAASVCMARNGLDFTSFEAAESHFETQAGLVNQDFERAESRIELSIVQLEEVRYAQILIGCGGSPSALQEIYDEAYDTLVDDFIDNER